MTQIVISFGGGQLAQPVATPHLAYPFTILASGAVVLQQDTVEEVASCIGAISACLIGERDDNPLFGIPDPLFAIAPIDVAALDAALISQEPRARLAITDGAGGSGLDPSQRIITINVGATGA